MRSVSIKPHCVAYSTPRSSGKDHNAADEAVNRNLKKEDLLEGTEILGGIHLIHYALECDGMLYF